ncbi:NOL1/NOP2/sun family protein [Leishmania donovani]|uniref:NOL1/NOP2/sun family protein n=1 Tax=Leishmania donovani TaxID=5661 RepID=A0A504Y4P6_LEIDO|nr:NOL1/NOP2/sun family protein [Leishmania donovani]TPP55059.1 NOL1/NOP2/sun family protein [Leishmania donovani]
MMRPTRRAFFDSFRAARGELDHLFSSMKSEQHMRRAVQQYLLPSLSRRLHRSRGGRLGRAQERSLFRTNASLLLQEARRRCNHRVAAATLDVVLAEPQLSRFAQMFEPAWVKDAVSSCRSAAELRVIEGVLRQHERRVLASGSAATSEGFLLAAAFGRSRATETAGDALPSSGAAEGGGAGVTISKEARVSAALAQPPSLTDLATTGGTGSDALWSSPEERAAAGLRGLQRHQRNLTAGPNVSFTRYFLHQGLVRHEGELMALYQAMRARPLDVSFRVVGGGDAASGAAQAPGLLSPHASAVHILLQRRRGLHRVPWLPPAMGAYTLDTRASIPADTVLANRQLLRSLARERLIVYQSLPSMLPIYYLDPQPGECVLDMCASPGNKTALILDCMHAGGNSHPHWPSTTTSEAGSTACETSRRALVGSGCVVANEAQASRISDLQERLRNVSPEGRMGRDALSWRLWHPGRGIEFFPLQCALLQRAVRLCKTGGRIVYATCTLNPLENEAVVSAVLRACGGAVELIPPPRPLPRRTELQTEEDVGGSVPPLRLTAGLRSWDVPSGAGGFLCSAAEAYAQGESAARLPPDMFAPTSAGAEGDRTDISGALQRCCRRVMPHLNGNADGFFVAVLEKRAGVPHMLGAAESRSLVAPPSRLDPASATAVGPTSPAAASLAVSLAGGSNILNDRGFVRLPPSHHLVLQHLGGFFTSAPPRQASSLATASSCMAEQPQQGECTSVQAFLERHGWTAVWCEGEGLRLLSQATVQLLRRHSTVPVAPPKGRPNSSALGFARHSEEASKASPAPPSTGTELLDAGVLVVGAQGELTERGAALIRPSARSRVVSLPLPFAQLLLANRTLDVGASLQLMPAYVQEAEQALGPQHGFLAPSSAATRGRDDPASSEAHTSTWYREALAALTPALGGGAGAAGNAIVVVRVSSSGPSASPSWAAPLAQWAWPVRVEVMQPWSWHDIGDTPRGLARLHLTLPAAARHRTQALIGRLQGHAHRQRSTQERLQASSRHDPSLIMGQQALHGSAMQASQQHRLLFGGAAQASALRAQPTEALPARDSTMTTPATPLSQSLDVFEL